MLTEGLVGLYSGPLDTRLYQFMLILGVSVKNDQFVSLDNLRLHLGAKYKLVGQT